MIKEMHSFIRQRGRTGKKAGVVVVCLCVAMCGLHLLEPKNTHMRRCACGTQGFIQCLWVNLPEALSNCTFR